MGVLVSLYAEHGACQVLSRWLRYAICAANAAAVE